MFCQDCGKKPATVHFTKIIDGKVTEIHLCEECAKYNEEFESSFSVHKFLTELIDYTYDEDMSVKQAEEIKCDKCGMTYAKFKQTGKLGCDHCYKVFEDKLRSVIKNIQGHNMHVGKIPEKSGEIIKIRKEINKLKDELTIMVKKEEFEEAAKIRDEIKELEKQTKS